MAEAVKKGDHAPDIGTLTVQVALTDDLIGRRESRGVGASRMREVKRLMIRSSVVLPVMTPPSWVRPRVPSGPVCPVSAARSRR